MTAVSGGLSKRTKIILIVAITLIVIGTVVFIYMKRTKSRKAEQAKKSSTGGLRKVSVTELTGKTATKSPTVAMKKTA